MHHRKYKPPRYSKYNGRSVRKQPPMAPAAAASKGNRQARDVAHNSRALRPRVANLSRCVMQETTANAAGRASHQALVGRRNQMSIKTTAVKPNASAKRTPIRKAPTALS